MGLPHATVQDHYRSIYFESLDLVIVSIKCFEQKGFEMIYKLELILASYRTPESQDIFEKVMKFYGSDLNKEHLRIQLTILCTDKEYL